MSRWNDPRRDDNAAALKRRLGAARRGRGAADASASRRLLLPLAVLGLLGLALIVAGLR